jgi:hypothetical protein
MTVASPEGDRSVAALVSPRLWGFDVVPPAGMAGHGKYGPAQSSDRCTVAVELVVL